MGEGRTGDPSLFEGGSRTNAFASPGLPTGLWLSHVHLQIIHSLELKRHVAFCGKGIGNGASVDEVCLSRRLSELGTGQFDDLLTLISPG